MITAAMSPMVSASVPNSSMMGGCTMKKKFRKFEFIAKTSHKASIASQEYFEPPRKSFFLSGIEKYSPLRWVEKYCPLRSLPYPPFPHSRTRFTQSAMSFETTYYPSM